MRKFVAFLASVLLKACKHSDDESDVEVLLSGMAYLSDELPWFRKEASKWGVSLVGVIPQKANLEYLRYYLYCGRIFQIYCLSQPSSPMNGEP